MINKHLLRKLHYLRRQLMQELWEFGAHTSFLASSPLFILLGYLAMVDAAFLATQHRRNVDRIQLQQGVNGVCGFLAAYYIHPATPAMYSGTMHPTLCLMQSFYRNVLE